MSQRDRTALYVTLPLSAAMLGAAVFVSYAGGMRRDDRAYQQIDIFTRTLNLVEQQYVEEVDSWEIVYDALEGLVERDPYSRFYDPSGAQRFNEDTHREYYGVGMVVPREGPLRIEYLMEDSPAEKAGLMPGDEILAVDGVNVEDLPEQDATAAIKGPLGTQVEMTIKVAASGQVRDFQVRRDKIAQRTVFRDHFQDPEGKIGYIRIEGFGENTAKEFDEILKDLLRKDIESLVLDLRYNQGGLVPSCRLIANRFLDEGILFGVRHRNSENDRSYTADPRECMAPDLPMVVLINEDTASAAEIVAGALQDHKRGLLVGTRSYGKGVVQSIYPIPLDNENHDTVVVKITTGEYLTPAGRIIEKQVKRKTPVRGGLDPDVKIELPKEQRSNLLERMSLIRVPAKYRDEYLAYHERVMPKRTDRQLDAALKVLRGETVAQDL